MISFNLGIGDIIRAIKDGKIQEKELEMKLLAIEVEFGKLQIERDRLNNELDKWKNDFNNLKTTKELKTQKLFLENESLKKKLTEKNYVHLPSGVTIMPYSIVNIVKLPEDSGGWEQGFRYMASHQTEFVKALQYVMLTESDHKLLTSSFGTVIKSEEKNND